MAVDLCHHGAAVFSGEETLESLFPEVGGIQERASEGARQQVRANDPLIDLIFRIFELPHRAWCF